MGREIVYCWKCAKRIDGSDFENLKAYRYGDKVSCGECVFDLVGDLPADEQEAILNGTAAAPTPPPQPKATTRVRPATETGRKAAQTGRVTRATGRIPTADAGAGTRSIPKRGTRSIPKVEAPPEEEAAPEVDAAAAKKKKLILIGAGGGGLLVVAVVVLLILLSGGKPKTPASTAVDADSTPKTTAKTPDPKASKEAAAQKAYDAAMAVFRDKPGDLGAQMKALREAELAAAGFRIDDDVKTQIEKVLNEVDKQLKAIDPELLPLATSDKFKDALDLLDKAQAKHDVPEWKAGVDKKIAYVKGRIDERFGQERKVAMVAKDNEDNAKVKEVVDKVKSWELPELVERLNKDLGSTGAAPTAPDAPGTAAPKTPAPAAKKPRREAKPLSKEMQSYQPYFDQALGLAFQRDFDGAATELRKAVKEIDHDDVRKAGNADIELLEKAKAWVEESVKAMAQAKRLERVALEYFEKPAEFRTVTGRITKVFDQRLELKADVEKDGKKTTATIFVEHADLSARTLAEQAKKILGRTDARLAGLLNLVEGNEEAAVQLGGKEAEGLPDRWWLFAAVAKDKCPKSNGKEFEARNLFHQAELEYASAQTRGPALDKYKTLTNEYATTRIVQRNQGAIVKRGETGKEYVFNARTLASEGSFKAVKKPDLVLQGTKDLDIQEMKDNWVEAEFYALPNLTYRAWALIGGCCKETFGAYLQTSDRTTSANGKQVPIDPGANMAEQLKNQISGLKADHAAHAPKDKKLPHPKEATRWEWVQIPLAKTYTASGAKGIRLMTDQAGFAVKFIVISTTRTKTPDPKETEEFVKQITEEPGKDDSGVKGTPEPKDWLLAGPFDEPLNKSNPPERDVDLAKEMTGKGNKKFKWKLASAATSAGGYATFNWEDGKLFNPKDNVSGYALIHVKAPTPMEVQISVGHDDGGRVWVNDQMVHSNDRGGGVKNDEFKAKASLEEGWNRILVKVRTANGGFGFSLRILDDKGNPAQGLEYSPYGDQLVPP